MGTERRGGEGGLHKKYVNIFNGMFETSEKELDPAKPYIVKRTTTKGKELIVDQFDAITGHIVGLEYVPESPVGKRLKLSVQDDKLYVIDIPYIGAKGWVDSYAKSLLLRLNNIYLDEAVRIAPYSFIPKDSDRKKEGFSLVQNEAKVQTAEDFESIPKWTKVEGIEEGDFTWDPTAETKWYHSLMKKQCERISDFMETQKPKAKNTEDDFSKGMAGTAVNVDTSNVPVMDVEGVEVDDDLPF